MPVSNHLFYCLEDFRNRYGGENEVVVVKLGTQPALPAEKLHGLRFGAAFSFRLVRYDHAGLKAARKAVFGGIPWQRCQFHLQQNAQAYVPRKEMRAEVANDIRIIINAPDRATAEQYLAMTVQKYAKTAARLADWMEKNIPEGLTVFSFPADHRRRLRTTNRLERVNKEVHRRKLIVSIFPNEAACLRLISAVLMEIDEEWQTGKIYLSMLDS